MISEGEGGHEAELSNTINIKRTDVLAGDSPPPSPASGCILATPSTCSFPFLLLAPLKKEKKRKKERIPLRLLSAVLIRNTCVISARRGKSHPRAPLLLFSPSRVIERNM